jgi:hypothetical protein
MLSKIARAPRRERCTAAAALARAVALIDFD